MMPLLGHNDATTAGQRLNSAAPGPEPDRSTPAEGQGRPPASAEPPIEDGRTSDSSAGSSDGLLAPVKPIGPGRQPPQHDAAADPGSVALVLPPLPTPDYSAMHMQNATGCSLVISIIMACLIGALMHPLSTGTPKLDSTCS
jgi:hypothetical protein